MSTPARSLKNDKFTFGVVIGILLCSLIYTSGYTLVVKEENEKFKHELKAIEQEMNVLFEFLPTPDAESLHKKQQILRQVANIRKEFYQNDASFVSKKELFSQLGEVKMRVGDLEERVKTVIEKEHEATSLTASIPEEEPVEHLLTSDIPQPRPARVTLQAVPVSSQESTPSKKLAVYYFHAYSSDKKSRYHRTRHLNVQLQLQGDVTLLTDPYLRIEIRDPDNNIITDEKDRIKAASEYMTSYLFELPPGQAFKKGRYVIRIYSADNQFQQLTFLFLV